MKLRYIIRDGEKVLQERVTIYSKNGTPLGFDWQDVPTKLNETREEITKHITN